VILPRICREEGKLFFSTPHQSRHLRAVRKPTVTSAATSVTTAATAVIAATDATTDAAATTIAVATATVTKIVPLRTSSSQVSRVYLQYSRIRECEVGSGRTLPAATRHDVTTRGDRALPPRRYNDRRDLHQYVPGENATACGEACSRSRSAEERIRQSRSGKLRSSSYPRKSLGNSNSAMLAEENGC